jgi:hypothetical protein
MQLSGLSDVYGGYTSGSEIALITGWAAFVQSDIRSTSPIANLPTDPTGSYWKVLLPAVHGAILLPGDIITDELGQTAVVQTSELTDLGWRVSAKMNMT